ncbi:(+)-delta-cadinene synthase [Heracleum sosnowskyi]|uniref:(+)-delta-cadinene synthase n=1 Tax=Heracleum sosnowskyi TaxID=360622 RepID=A0AAD8HJS7_9APIA|nr:(+)-delta-cadinene synthase [Heracleum sosnowskyi]
MADVFCISPLVTSCNFRRFTPCEPKFVTACNSVIKFVNGTTEGYVLPEPIIRRSGNYEPSMWDNNFLQSLKSDYTGETINARASALKEEVSLMFNNVVEPLDQLELIDRLQRLGLGYHFQEEINCTLKKIQSGQIDNNNREKDLHATALEFRLLRQHGFFISPEGFKRFIGNGNFICPGADIKGMLSLYEASYFSIEGETLMEAALYFTSKSLKECLPNITDVDLQIQVRHALELPLQWRIPRFDARWNIELYERSSDMIPAVLEFAKLDFNISQGLYQEELKDLSRWWCRLGIGEKLPFARDRLVSSYIWSLGISSMPQDQYCRVQLTKIIQLIGVCDDAYDVYGTLDELELFTDVVERWDVNAIEELPYYMKICFLSFYNFVHETYYDILKEQEIDILSHQRKWWIELFKHQLVEARWYHGGHQPTMEEYLSNGLVSIAGPIGILYSYICTEDPIKKEEVEFIEGLPDIVRLACEIFRLADDYGTSSAELERGDVPSSIQCYMLDAGVSEEVARKHMMDLMRKKWAQVNKCRFSGDHIPLSWHVVDIMLNIVRAAHCLYNAGDDGFGVEDGLTKDTLFSLLVKPIPLRESKAYTA